MASPYQVLRISDPDTAVWGDVYRAYRRRAKETHPDLGGNADEFRAVQEAFDTLLQWAADDAAAESDHDPEPPQTTPAAESGPSHEAFVDEHPPPLVTPRIRGAWRRRRPSDPPPYTPRRSAPTGPRRAAPESDPS